jgi:hypothetical protein
MLKSLQNVYPIVFLIAATTLEASGDVIVRLAIYDHFGAYRVALFVAGAALLLGYGTLLRDRFGLIISCLFRSIRNQR